MPLMGAAKAMAVICRRERRRRTLLLVAVRAKTRKIPDILARVRQEEILAVLTLLRQRECCCRHSR